MFYGNALPYLVAFRGFKEDSGEEIHARNVTMTSQTVLLLEDLFGDTVYEIELRARTGAGAGSPAVVTQKLPPGPREFVYCSKCFPGFGFNLALKMKHSDYLQCSLAVSQSRV